MSGHNKWSQIKHQKDVADQKRGKIFSKILNTISIAARTDSNPEFNPKLRSAIQKARDLNVPNENIERAIKKILEPDHTLEELVLEAYGPSGSAIVIEAITDNRNRTVAEVKKIISDCEGRWAEPGSVTWAFEKNHTEEGIEWRAKFPQSLESSEMEKLKNFIAKLELHDDIQKTFTNVTL